MAGALLSKYKASSHSPGKWQKLATFLRQSLDSPILDLIKRFIDQVGSEKNSLTLKCRSIENQLNLVKKQLEAKECTTKQTRLREDGLRKDFSNILSEKKDELKDKATKIMQVEEHLTTLGLELKIVESKIGSYDVEVSSLRYEIKELKER
ncbi:interferon-induced guanylate-binding protein 2 [Cucumis melo var. makuwa]|uniref:Interferon-induced guanylate-binding protein 2 n=1 Tax=Cucumis melo var. makuwa TaxID=1194695 RepID=A0A5D3E279_CUCMM|nr:interferon-induced guanylate-binding protein 2 [Cucumis melo var. makuwa]TYK30203.1 interferon-induced guanylate-binding protein 2 [Cucumis melo var. makuwa]